MGRFSSRQSKRHCQLRVRKGSSKRQFQFANFGDEYNG
jgi:hypothetical protein